MVSETDDILVRYQKREFSLLLDEYGLINGMPIELVRRTLDCIEVYPDGQLKVVFLIGENYIKR